MGNKRLLAWLIVVIVLGGAAISSALVFRVNIIMVEFKNDIEYIQDEKAASKVYVKAASSVAKGRNILIGLNRKKIKNAIENADPRISVRNIEAKIPNKLEIRVRERYPLYYFTDETSGRTAIMDATLRIVTDGDDFDRINDKRDASEKLVKISGQFEVNEEFVDFEAGDSLAKYCVDELDLLKFQTLADMAGLFAGQKINEDALSHLFESVIFSYGANMEMQIRSERAQGNIINIEIRQVNDRFAIKLSAAWYVLENKSEYEPGRIVIETAEDSQIHWMWFPNSGLPEWGIVVE